MSTETETPAWVAPGSDVLVISGRDGTQVIRTEIAKVHKRYFTVTHRTYIDSRFSLDRQEARPGDVWSIVVPVNSPRGRDALEAARLQRLVRDAEQACADWQRKPTQDSRLAAIAALQAVED